MNFYAATIPVFTNILSGLSIGLDKAVAYADHKKFDVQVLLDARLAPDMYSYIRQIQAACDQTKYSASKLAGKTAPSIPDTEKNLAEIRARIQTAKDYLATFKPVDFEGAEERDITYTWMQGKSMRGADYLMNLSLPNLLFHATAAYAILRHNGVPLSKMDFMPNPPFKS